MKATLRQELLSRREALSGEERRRQSQAVVDRLFHWPIATRARVVLGYAPLPAEIDILPYLDTRAREGVRTLLPRMEGQELTLHDWRPGDDLERGPFGVREPTANANRAEPAEVQLAIVPGVGFDRTGHRLGFGRGFYDRLLRQIPLPLRVGVSFDAQVVDRLPAEDHDQRVAWLLVAGGLTHFAETT